MSTPFYDLASLVLVPSGYKTSKVYAQKPLTTDGQLAFTRASTATRVGPDGLIEKVRTNLTLYSQDFTNAAWFKEAGNTVTADTIANPLNGAVDADTITATDTNAINVNQLFTAAVTSEHTYSIYLKKNNHDLVQPYLFSVAAAGFVARIEINLNDGTFTTLNGSGATVTSVGNGWYRVTLIAPFSTSNVFTTGILTASTTGSRSVYVFGAQLESGVATPYIPTTTAAVSVGMLANVPRLDYTGGGCPKLLLEPQRTNSAQFSEQTDNAFWSKSVATITANQATAPDGTISADLLTATAADAVIFKVGVTAGAMSFFIKVGTLSAGARFRISVDGVGSATWNQNGTLFAVSGGTATNAIDYGNGWYRCNYNVTSGSVLNYGLANNISGDTAFIWGIQNEASATYATSYIPTLGAAVTRSVDAASKTGISALIGQTEGTVFCEVSFKTNDAGTYLSIEDWANLELVRLYSDAGPLNAQIYNSVNVFLAQTSYNAVVGQSYKMALAYSASGAAFYVNGVLVGQTTSSVSVPTCSNVRLAAFTSGQEMNADIKQALLFKTRLSNAQLAELTA